jgi:4-aminobutyrate aminotransferase/(S)-3-amino-2-methylpropionate transaminase
MHARKLQSTGRSEGGTLVALPDPPAKRGSSKTADPAAYRAAPTNAELWARRQNAVPRGVASSTQLFAARADNAYVWDTEGRRYIDFAGGIGVLNTGHRNPEVMKRVRAQLDRFTHTCFQVLPYESYVALAERINAIAPGAGPKKTIFLSTGAEAVENAVKIARAATGRSAVIAFAGGFHGRTMMTMALTGKVAPYKKQFGPFPAEVYHARYPSAYRGITPDDSIQDLERLFKADVDPNRVAAIIIEPVQGEGGFNVASPEFLRKLRELCDKHGILMIADEVQSGFGRTGKMFAIEHSGVAPDLITMAKSLAGGFPLSGVVGRAEVMDAVEPGGLGGTYAGSPVACEAALGVLDAMEKGRLLDRSTAIGERMRARLSKIAETVPEIGDVRGLGGMIAIELVKDRATRTPDPDLTKKVTAKALEHGLVLLSCGTDGNVLRILVPLTAKDKVIDEGLDIIERSIKEASGRSES